jgi:hypothetical protein
MVKPNLYKTHAGKVTKNECMWPHCEMHFLTTVHR